MKTLLIVDDEPNCLKLYTREFLDEGYEVLTAPDAQSGIELTDQRRPDCIVVDIRLPDMDGLSLIQRLLSRRPNTPIVINSSFHDAKDHFLSWCARAYIVKSSNLEELKRAVAEAIADGERTPAPRTANTSPPTPGRSTADRSTADRSGCLEA